MARPQIPDVIKNRIEEIHKQHRGYEANSFQEALSTVADLAKKKVHESKLDEELPFHYDVEDFSSGIKIQLVPKPNSNIERTSSGLETPKALIKTKDLFEKFKQIDGVRTAHGTSDIPIEVIIREGTERSFDELVDEIFAVLSRAIHEEENKIEQIEERADQYASRMDSSDQ